MFLRRIWRLLLLSFGFFSKALSESILYHSHSLNFGHFYDWDHCPNNSFANGFEIKADEEEKNFSDQEGMTGLRLRCANQENEELRLISSYSNYAGSWKGMKRCNPGEWLTGFRIKIQSYGWWIKDDTAANDIEMVCNRSRIYDGGGTHKGDWTEWNFCKEDEAICSVRTRVEDAFTPDRVGLVAVLFKCCNLYFNNDTESELWTSNNSPQTTNNQSRFTSPTYSSDDIDSSSYSTKSQSSDSPDFELFGVTGSRSSDSTDSQLSSATRSRYTDSTDSQLSSITRSQSSDSTDSTDSQLSSVTRSEYSDSTDSQLSSVTRSQSSDSTDSHLFGVTRSQSSASTDSIDSQLSSVTRSQYSGSTDSNESSFLTESQSSDSSWSHSSVSTEPYSSDSTKNQQVFPFAPIPSDNPNSRPSMSTGSSTSYSTELDSANSLSSVSVSSRFPLSTESQSSESSSASIESGFSSSTKSSLLIDEIGSSDYSSDIPGSIFTTEMPRSSTSKEIIFPDTITSSENDTYAVGYTEQTNNPSSDLYGNGNVPGFGLNMRTTTESATKTSIDDFDTRHRSTTLPNGTSFDEKSNTVTPVGEPFTIDNFYENQGADTSFNNNSIGGSDIDTENGKTSISTDGSSSETPRSFESSTLSSTTNIFNSSVSSSDNWPSNNTQTNWKTTPNPFSATTSANDFNSSGLEPRGGKNGSGNNTNPEDDEYVPFGLAPPDETYGDKDYHPKKYPPSKPHDDTNINNINTTGINLNDIFFGPKKDDDETIFRYPFNGSTEPIVEGAREGKSYPGFFSQRDEPKNVTDPNLAIFVMLGLAVTATVVLSLMGLGYYIKKRKRKMSIDPRYKYVISVRHVKPIDPIACE